MKALVLRKIGNRLELEDWPKPEPVRGEVLVRVLTCGICRTDLHIMDGDLGGAKLPLVLGHQVVGVIEGVGEGVRELRIGDKVGVPWLGGSCQVCRYCRGGRENLCDEAEFTGYQRDGGYAEYVVARWEYCLRLPGNYTDLHMAPLLCGGLVGYRAYRMLGEVEDIGFYGFGSSAHILVQVAVAEGKRVYGFTREGDLETQEFARGLGAVWAGGSVEVEKDRLDGAIIFAAAGELIPMALRNLRKGGVVVSAEIHMSDIPSFPYRILWNERVIRSVANLTRVDGKEFLEKAGGMEIKTEVREFRLEEGNEAIEYLRSGKVRGSAVLRMGY